MLKLSKHIILCLLCFCSYSTSASTQEAFRLYRLDIDAGIMDLSVGSVFVGEGDAVIIEASYIRRGVGELRYYDLETGSDLKIGDAKQMYIDADAQRRVVQQWKLTPAKSMLYGPIFDSPGNYVRSANAFWDNNCAFPLNEYVSVVDRSNATKDFFFAEFGARRRLRLPARCPYVRKNVSYSTRTSSSGVVFRLLPQSEF